MSGHMRHRHIYTPHTEVEWSMEDDTVYLFDKH